MRRWKRRWLSLWLIAWLLLCSVPATGSPGELVTDALARADGDTTAAMLLMAEDTLLLTDSSIQLERDLRVANAWGELLEKRAKLTDPPWWEQLWNSNLTKVLLFCFGAWVGTEMVVVK